MDRIGEIAKRCADAILILQRQLDEQESRLIAHEILLLTVIQDVPKQRFLDLLAIQTDRMQNQPGLTDAKRKAIALRLQPWREGVEQSLPKIDQGSPPTAD